MDASYAQLKRTLQGIGLNDKEVSAYLVLQQMGTAAASTVAKHANMTRPTAQYTCNQLATTGLISKAQRGNTFLYSAEKPERLLSFLERKQQNLRRQGERVERIIGDLYALQHPDLILPRTRFFEGKQGLIDAYEEVLSDLEEGEEIVGYLKALELPDPRFDLEKTYAKFVKQRVAKKVSTRIIGLETETLDKRYSSDKAALRETLMLPAEDWEHEAVEVMIFKNKMYTMTIEHNSIFGYIVENTAVTAMHRRMFEVTWKYLKSSSH